MMAERVRGLKLNLIGEPIKFLFRPTEADFDTVRQYAADFPLMAGTQTTGYTRKHRAGTVR